MKNIFILLIALPLFTAAQKKAASSAKTNIPASTNKKPVNGFVINGQVTGYAEGTPVFFFNEQTGQPEQKAIIKSGRFTITGKLQQPAFLGLSLGQNEPPVVLFLDNSVVSLKGDKTALDNFIITGSPSHDQYTGYNTALKPYAHILQPEGLFDSVLSNMAARISEDFVRKNPSSYVAPLAIIRYYQLTENPSALQELYGLLPQHISQSALGTYVAQQVAESKVNPIGSVINDFIQADPEGKNVSVSSFKGKYVLIDFWASWCRPCRMENPNVVAAYNKFKDKNFTVLGISFDQAKNAWLSAIQMDNLAWSHVSDLKGWQNAAAAQFQVNSIPQNLLIDTEGRIIGKNLRGPALERKLLQVLK